MFVELSTFAVPTGLLLAVAERLELENQLCQVLRVSECSRLSATARSASQRA
jgi:hypothetical protein